MLKAITLAITLSLSLFANEPNATPNEGQERVELNQEEVVQFVVALIRVDQVRQELGVVDEDGNVIEQKAKEFEEQATQVVKDEGLSLEQYGKYSQLLQNSEEFRQIVQSIIAQMQEQNKE